MSSSRKPRKNFSPTVEGKLCVGCVGCDPLAVRFSTVMLSILPLLGRREYAVERIKSETFSSKFLTLRDNLKGLFYGNKKIEDKDSSLKNLFGRTCKMIK